MKAKRVCNLVFAALATPTFAFAGTTAWVGNIGDDSISIIDVSDIDGDESVDEVLFTVKPMCTNCIPGQICNPNILVPCINGPHDIAFSPDGHWAYVTAYHGDRLVILDASPLLEIPPEAPTFASRIAAGDRPQGVAVSPDGYYAYVANSSSNNMQVFEVYQGLASSLTTVTVGNDPNGIAVTSDGSEVWVTNNLGDSVSVIDTSDYSVSTITSVGNAPRRVILGEIPDGEGTVLTAFTVNAYGDSFTAINATNHTIIEEIKVDTDDTDQTSLPRGIALHPDQEEFPQIYITEFESMQVSVFESNGEYTLLDEINHSSFGSPHRIAITPNGAKGYIANPDDDQVTVLNVVTGEMVATPVAVENGPGGTAILVQN